MIFESKEQIEGYLRENRNFEECLLVDVRWRHFGTVIEFLFDYTWDASGEVLPEYAPVDLRILAFRNVQELRISNALNDHMTMHPDELDWGFSAVATVRVLDEEHFISKYQTLAMPFHHLRCSWDRGRRIDIIFSTLEIIE